MWKLSQLVIFGSQNLKLWDSTPWLPGSCDAHCRPSRPKSPIAVLWSLVSDRNTKLGMKNPNSHWQQLSMKNWKTANICQLPTSPMTWWRNRNTKSLRGERWALLVVPTSAFSLASTLEARWSEVLLLNNFGDRRSFTSICMTFARLQIFELALGLKVLFPCRMICNMKHWEQTAAFKYIQINKWTSSHHNMPNLHAVTAAVALKMPGKWPGRPSLPASSRHPPVFIFEKWLFCRFFDIIFKWNKRVCFKVWITHFLWKKHKTCFWRTPFEPTMEENKIEIHTWNLRISKRIGSGWSSETNLWPSHR